ncbi:MAG TPA: membrane protein insertion efficiency factor YidD [Kiritimatiellia bacterium]|nr:membrane protein insertion efficiency factor YidD [Kiritimatiellia bacterium]
MKLLHACLLIILPPFGSVRADDFGPWSSETEHPVTFESTIGIKEKSRDTNLRASEKQREEISLSFVLLAFYQENLSGMLTGRCPMQPSCSRYSVEAISRFGPLRGIPMTVDRLIHEGSVQKDCPLVKTENGLRFHDPIEDNLIKW